MQHLLGYCVARAAVPAFQVFEKEIGAPFALRRVDYTILVLVDSNAGATQKQLARSLQLSLPYLTITLDRMQARGLLVRERSVTDRRLQHVRLTDEGRKLLEAAEGIAATMEGSLLSSLTPGERTMLLELLRKVAAFHPRPLHRGGGHGIEAD